MYLRVTREGRILEIMIYSRTLKKRGNSMALYLPATLIKAIMWNHGDNIAMVVEDVNTITLHRVSDKQMRKMLESKQLMLSIPCNNTSE